MIDKLVSVLTDKRTIIFIVLIGVLAFTFGGGLFSVFFMGGETQAVTIDRSGDYGSPTTYSYAQGELSANSFGATYWALKAKSENGYDRTGKEMTVFFYTHPNICSYQLKEDTNPLDVLAVVKTFLGGDYKIYKPILPTRGQDVDVIVLGPDEDQIKSQLQNLLQQSNSGIPFYADIAKTQFNAFAKGQYGHTFDAYEDDVVSVGPNGIYKVKFSGTHQGEKDCESLVDPDTVLIYSASQNKIVPVDRSKITSYTSTQILDAVKRVLGFPVTSTAPDISSDELEAKTYSISGGSFNIVNPRPGNIQVTVLAPTNLFYNPITNDVSETETPGSTPVQIDFDYFGEPSTCDLEIRDIAFSGDNTNTYAEGSRITTYVKVANKASVECLATVKATSKYSTAQSSQVRIGGYETKQIPVQITIGQVTSDLDTSIRYSVCSSSIASGTECLTKDVSYRILDQSASVIADPVDESPEPQPDLSCEERAQSRECTGISCEFGKYVSKLSCSEYLLPSILGFSFLSLLFVGILGYLALRGWGK